MGIGMNRIGMGIATAELGYERYDNGPTLVLTLEHFGVLGHGGTEMQ